MKNKVTTTLIILIMAISFVGVLYFFPSESPTTFVVLEETEVKDTFVYVVSENITQEEALRLLMESEMIILEMETFDVGTTYVSDLLLDAQRSFIGSNIPSFRQSIKDVEDNSKQHYIHNTLLVLVENTAYFGNTALNYSEVLRLHQLINHSRNQAYNLLDKITLFEEKLIEHEERGLEANSVRSLFDEVETSFAEERFDESEAYLEEAELQLHKLSAEETRVKELAALSKNFFVRNWLNILLSIIILAFILHPTILFIRKKIARKRIKQLQRELKNLERLQEKNQKSYFMNKIISKTLYDTRLKHYEERISEIQSLLPVLESFVNKKEKKNTEKKGGLEV